MIKSSLDNLLYIMFRLGRVLTLGSFKSFATKAPKNIKLKVDGKPV